MIKLGESDYYKIELFINDNVPNATVLNAVIDGTASANVWVDNPDNINIIFVNTGLLFSFFLGECSSAALLEISKLPVGSLAEYIYFPLPSDDQFISGKFSPVNFIEYVPGPDTQKQCEYWLNNVPDGYSLSTITSDNSADCSWFPLVSSIFGGIEKFFKHGVGFCLKYRESVASEAYSGYFARNNLEIATVTKEGFSNRNLSSIVCSHLIIYAFSNNWNCLWSCEETNKSSNAVAKKLGFIKRKSYILYKLM